MPWRICARTQLHFRNKSQAPCTPFDYNCTIQDATPDTTLPSQDDEVQPLRSSCPWKTSNFCWCTPLKHLTSNLLKRLKTLPAVQRPVFLQLHNVFRRSGNAQKSDEECSQVRRFCQEGWPLYMPQQPLLRPYWEHRAHQVVVDDLLLHNKCIVIPWVFRLEVLDCIHRGHLGISECRARARMTVWWPGLSGSMEDKSNRASHVQRNYQNLRNPWCLPPSPVVLGRE